MSIARRSITSVSWNAIANMVGIIVGLARSILLARLLPVDVFGVYGWAGSLIAMTAVFASFGMGGAFLHRAPETEDEEQTATVHFTLQVIFTSIWAILLTVCTLVLASGETRTALLLLTATSAGTQLVSTPRLILARRVVHRRLASIQIASNLVSTATAVVLAWHGATLWALLSTDLIGLAISIWAFYIWRPIWRPRLTWSPKVMRHYLSFGARNLLAIVLLRMLDRVDDLWTGVFLGNTSLGFYSRAYSFATYPRRLLAAPINMVAGGTYAELKGDRPRLSRAFFRINAFLIRSGFLLAGLLTLVAPEFIRLLLSAKWLPMLNAFRLMLVFTLMDPIKVTIGDLFVANGKPEKVARIRLLQLFLLVAGLLLFGPWLGISGVALAVDLMVVTGIVILLWEARAFVDFSAVRLFAVPGIALVTGMALTLRAIDLLSIPCSDWCTGIVKIGVFLVSYGGILLALEHRQILREVQTFRFHLPRNIRGKL